MSGTREEKAPVSSYDAACINHRDLAEALRDLYKICCSCDLDGDAERPTEEQYNATMDAAEAAIGGAELAAGQLTLQAIRYTDALKRIENQAAEWTSLEQICKEQHRAIAACADALHQARRAIAAYVEVKDTEHERRAGRGRKAP